MKFRKLSEKEKEYVNKIINNEKVTNAKYIGNQCIAEMLQLEDACGMHSYIMNIIKSIKESFAFYASENPGGRFSYLLNEVVFNEKFHSDRRKEKHEISKSVVSILSILPNITVPREAMDKDSILYYVIDIKYRKGIIKLLTMQSAELIFKLNNKLNYYKKVSRYLNTGDLAIFNGYCKMINRYTIILKRYSKTSNLKYERAFEYPNVCIYNVTHYGDREWRREAMIKILLNLSRIKQREFLDRI